MHCVSDTATYTSIVIFVLYLALAYWFISVGLPRNCRCWVCKLHKFVNYVYGFLVLSLVKIQFQSIVIFSSFFVWSVNCSSLICKLWILCWIFPIRWTILIFQVISFFYSKIIFNWWHCFGYFLLVNKLYELNVFKLHIIFQICQKA